MLNSVTTSIGVKYKYIKSFSYFQLFLIYRGITPLFFFAFSLQVLSYHNPKTGKKVTATAKNKEGVKGDTLKINANKTLKYILEIH